jgi:DDE superfamily endonuclease
VWSSWTIKKWERVLFSDETKINLYSSDGRIKVWRKPKKALEDGNFVSTVKHGGGGVLLWGSMSSNGVGNLVVIDSIMDKILYKKILVQNLEASVEKLGLGDDFIFQQDNDPKHRAEFVLDFFDENDINLLEWPSQSPDLNPIEHLWDYIKRELRKRDIKSIKKLKEVIMEIWTSIPADFCKRLVYTMPDRIEEVIRAKGKHTNY